MTDLVSVVSTLAAGVAADPLIGLAGTATPHLLAVDPDADWLSSPLPNLTIHAPSTEREAITPTQERVTAVLELVLTLDGRQGQGSHRDCWALAEGVRRYLVRDRLLARGSPLAALLEISLPKGEEYEVFRHEEQGWFQRGIVRWEARWLEPRTFPPAQAVVQRLLRTIDIVRDVTEDQPVP